MPYRPSKVHPRQKRTLSALNIFELCTGSCFFWGDRLSAADLPQAWRSVREPLTARYAQHCPGNRPRAWWLFEAPMPRQCVQGAHACPQRDRILREAKGGQLYYGRPGVYCCALCWDECYESPARYLRRLQLLTPVEEPVIPGDLGVCDAWATARYADDHPHPWGATGHAIAWCAAFLQEGPRIS